MDYVLLASVLSTNKTFLFDAHKEMTGKTPNEYINDLLIPHLPLSFPKTLPPESGAIQSLFQMGKSF